MNIDRWQALGVVCGALIAALTLTGLVYRWVMRPVYRTFRRLGLMSDDFLGDKARGLPSLPERIARLADQLAQQGHRLDEHLTWHSGTGRVNGPRPVSPVDRERT